MGAITARWQDFVGQWNHRLPQGLCLVGNRFREPIRGNLLILLTPPLLCIDEVTLSLEKFQGDLKMTSVTVNQTI